VPTYTVIGQDDVQSYGVVVQAASPWEAERQAILDENLTHVVSVVQGRRALNPKTVQLGDVDWTVAGFYGENLQRYVTSVPARSAKAATAKVKEEVVRQFSLQLQSNDPSLPSAEADKLAAETLDFTVIGAILRDVPSLDTYANGEQWAYADFAVREIEKMLAEGRMLYDTEPRYVHDCDACVFIGHYNGADIWDPAHEGNGSIIVRHSSVGPDYESGTQARVDGEWLTAADSGRIKQMIEEKLAEPALLALIENGSRGHPAPRTRLSALAAGGAR
jgi:hypothetical protein